MGSVPNLAQMGSVPYWERHLRGPERHGAPSFVTDDGELFWGTERQERTHLDGQGAVLDGPRPR